MFISIQMVGRGGDFLRKHNKKFSNLKADYILTFNKKNW